MRYFRQLRLYPRAAALFLGNAAFFGGVMNFGRAGRAAAALTLHGSHLELPRTRFRPQAEHGFGALRGKQRSRVREQLNLPNHVTRRLLHVAAVTRGLHVVEGVRPSLRHRHAVVQFWCARPPCAAQSLGGRAPTDLAAPAVPLEDLEAIDRLTRNTKTAGALRVPSAVHLVGELSVAVPLAELLPVASPWDSKEPAAPSAWTRSAVHPIPSFRPHRGSTLGVLGATLG